MNLGTCHFRKDNFSYFFSYIRIIFWGLHLHFFVLNGTTIYLCLFSEHALDGRPYA